MNPHDRLKHHVTGAIERGEAEPIIEQRPKVRTGSFGLRYVTPDEVKEVLLPHHKAGLSFTATGYGNRIPTTKMARVGKKWYRIYCRIFSNAGTCYIEYQGMEHIVEEV